MILSPDYDHALSYAAGLHRRQMRKATAIPYVAHLLAVSALVLENGGDETQAIAGLLHDAAEDQGGAETLAAIRQRFGEDVAAIVADCTDAWSEPKPPWRERKEAYLESLPKKPTRSLLVSLADKTHNARAISTDYRAIGDALWSRFSGGRDGTVWYYTSLAAIFERALPGPLARELGETVGRFSRG